MKTVKTKKQNKTKKISQRGFTLAALNKIWSEPPRAHPEFIMWSLLVRALNTELGAAGYFPIQIHT